jgi:hypothetical protein
MLRSHHSGLRYRSHSEEERVSRRWAGSDVIEKRPYLGTDDDVTVWQTEFGARTPIAGS